MLSPLLTSSSTSRGASLATGLGIDVSARLGLDLDPSGPGEVVRGALRDEPSARDDCDPVADELDLAEEVRVEQHGDAPLLEVLEQATDGPAAGRIERARRLVEQEQVGRPDEGLREPKSLLHPLRHRVDGPFGGVLQPNQSQQLRSLRRSAFAAREPLVKGEQLVSRVPAGKPEELGEVAEPQPGGSFGRGRAVDRGGAFGRPNEAAGDLDEGGLARSVGPEKADKLTAFDREVDAGQGYNGVVPLLEPLDREGRRHPASQSTGPRREN